MEGQVDIEQISLVLEDVHDELQSINWFECDQSLPELSLLNELVVKNVVDETNQQIELRDDNQNELSRLHIDHAQQKSLEDHEH